MTNAVFIPSEPSQPGSLAQLVTIQWDGVLQIYDLAEDYVRRKVELHIKPEGCSSTRFEILRVASSLSSRDLAVLYRRREHTLETPFSPKSITYVCDCEVYKLVTFHRCFAKTLGYFYDSFLQETRDIRAVGDQTPVGLALASNGNACIVWNSTSRLEETTICLIRRSEKIMVRIGLMQSLIQ